MSIAWPALAGMLLILAFLTAVACYGLRDFSRSRLEEICRRHGREQRFSTILKTYEPVLLAAEFLQVAIWIALVAVVGFWLQGLETVTAPAESASATGIGPVAGLCLLIPVLYGVGVVFPWTMARVAGEGFLYHTWPFWSGFRTALSPLIAVVRRFDNLAHRVAGLEEPEAEDAGASITDEIRTVVDEGQREGILRSDARTMIHRVMELQEVDVADVMTPRTAMVCMSSEDSLEQARQLLLEAGHSRVPVIGKTTDDIVGMLYAKDLLRHLHAIPDQNLALANIARTPFYVPETMGIDTLLKTFKKERVHLAIVLDEYGGVAGLVTMEDILEEIVGEIVDEYDTAEPDPIHTIAPGITEIDARLHIDDVNEKLELNLPSDGDYDTVGGFAFSLLGRIPAQGEEFRWEQLRFKVLEADKRKIVRLRIEVDQSIPATSNEQN